MIPGLSRAAFNEPPEVLFNGKTVCVTGLIVDYRGKPEIVVEDPSQIVIQEAAPATASEATTNTSQKAPTPPPSQRNGEGHPVSASPTARRGNHYGVRFGCQRTVFRVA